MGNDYYPQNDWKEQEIIYSNTRSYHRVIEINPKRVG